MIQELETGLTVGIFAAIDNVNGNNGEKENGKGGARLLLPPPPVRGHIGGDIGGINTEGILLEEDKTQNGNTEGSATGSSPPPVPLLGRQQIQEHGGKVIQFRRHAGAPRGGEAGL